MTVIDASHVTKEYRLGTFKSLQQSIADIAGRLRGRTPPERPCFKALDDINFSVEKGEVLGLIGHNGAGKSTLLKLLAGIVAPTHGSVKTRGKIAPLIEVGAGLIGDLTGRENIYLNGTILGMSRKEIRKKFDEIVAFSELEEFIDTPIKRYSSGMQVRLGFSVATSIDSDILIVDEVLAVGDLAFQRKCFDRIEEMIKRSGRTVLLVSHNIRQVERLCSRVILLDHGRILKDGFPHEVCHLFYERSDEKIRKSISSLPGKRAALATGEIEILHIDILDANGCETSSARYKQGFTLRLRLQVHEELHEVTFGFGIHTTDFLYVTTHNSEEQLRVRSMKPGVHEVQCRVEQLPLLPGVYSLRVGITEGQAARNIFYAENLYHLQIEAGPTPIPITVRDGFFEMSAEWAVIEGENNVESVAGRPSFRSVTT